MDVRIKYGSVREQTAAIRKYINESESRSVLLLIRSATEMYNNLVQDGQQINLNLHLAKLDEDGYVELIAGNLQKLIREYDYPLIRNPEYLAHDVRSFLIKMWWMGYGQLPEFADSKIDSGKYLNWKYFKESLEFIMSFSS